MKKVFFPFNPLKCFVYRNIKNNQSAGRYAMCKMKKSARVFKTGQSCINGKQSLKNRIVWLSVFLFLFMGLIPSIANANPPKSLTLNYDANKKVLRVTIFHPSFAPSLHYIKTVTIEKNKQPLASYSYNIQTGDEFTNTYEIPVAQGDTLVVTASCSMYGSRTEIIKIP
jgi:hypothetical protein